MAKLGYYAVYKGETMICTGTKKECAAHMNVLPDTIRYYASPAYSRRVKKRKSNNSIIVVRLEEDER
jgi:hypothetical protein